MRVRLPYAGGFTHLVFILKGGGLYGYDYRAAKGWAVNYVK